MGLAAGDVTVSLLTGLLGSVMFWYLQFRVFRVRLRISSKIARRRRTRGNWLSQIKIANRSRRDCIDLSLVVRARLPNFVVPGMIEVLTLTQMTFPLLSGKAETMITIRPEDMPEYYRRRYSKVLPEEMVAAIRDGSSVDLLDFMSLAVGTRIEVHVFATDALSGARGYARVSFAATDVVNGRYTKGSLNVSPLESSGTLGGETQTNDAVAYDRDSHQDHPERDAPDG